MMGLENKVIISAALTGAMTPTSLNPHIPVEPEQIAEDAYRSWQAGASTVHLHMRDEEQLGTMDKDRFLRSVELIRAHTDCDVVINCTTAGDHRATDEERMAHLPLCLPEIASYDVGTFNWMPDGVFTNTPQFLAKLGVLMQELNIKPELEVFDSGFMGIADHFLKQGVLIAPLHYQFVLGVPGGMAATVENLDYLVRQVPTGSTWSAFGIGRHHLPMMFATLALGGHVRVGLEDNVYYSKGVPATNVSLVERAVRVVREFGKEPATPDEARQLLSLK